MIRSVAKLNDLLRRELGENPRYSWRHSSTLMRVMDARDANGQVIYDTVFDPDTLLFKTVPKKKLRLLAPDLNKQWVLCALVRMTPEQGSIEGTGEYAWVPVRSDRTSEACALPEGTLPTQTFTEEFIAAMKAMRLTTPAEKEVTFARAQEQFDRAYEAVCYDAIRDACTAYYQIPGQKGSVAFQVQGQKDVQ